MAILHIMHNKNWDNGFITDENAILTVTPYEPEVLILGTFNPDTLANNEIADFFYGRNYFWPAFYNLHENNPILLLQRRNVAHLPLLQEIFNLCKHFKLSFADLIRSVMHVGNPDYNILGNVVHFNGQQYNLIKDSALADLNALQQVEWNNNAIVQYLTDTTTIHTVYLTRQPTGVYWQRWHTLVSYANFGRKINFNILYTPSAQALRGTPRIVELIRHWLWNNNPNYNNLSHEWLMNKHVNPAIFNQ